jgi:hypothetical protein
LLFLTDIWRIMNEMDHTNSNIEQVSVHQVGNKANQEPLKLSKSPLDISDDKLRELLTRYFLPPFSSREYHSFTFTNGDFKLNPIYVYTNAIFDDPKSFQDNSINIAKHLYEVSTHPQIKPGDLFIVFFSGIVIDGRSVDAIGIFKSETYHAFLKLSSDKSTFTLNYDDGINIEKLDKGCLIFNLEQDSGYKLCIVDKTSKGPDAAFWTDNFLMVRQVSDNFHFTKNLLSAAKDFITNRLPSEFEVQRTDQIDYLQKSVSYFKDNETFNIKDFEEKVFEDSNIISSFRKFGSAYLDQNDIEIADTFDISPQAVKKQERIFKSVLKLDKNFHVYIHGNTDLIEKGYDSRKGKSFYKIYFDEEK